MLILQHNCRKAYATTIAALELGLQLETDIVCLQEPYISTEFRHGSYLLYWPERGDRKSARVVIAVRRELLNKKVIDARIDLLNHPYLMIVDVWDLDRDRNQTRRTRVINCYDNWVGTGQCWQGDSTRRRRAIEDAQWEQVMEGRCLLAGDFNAHSSLWNSHTRTRSNAVYLEGLIEQYGLHINNTPGESTRPKVTPGISVIDLTLTSPELGVLPLWLIDKEHPTGSDHEVIITEWKDPESLSGEGKSIEESICTGWQIQALQADSKTLDQAEQAWEELTTNRPLLTDLCTREEIAEEAVWIEKTFTKILDQYAKPIKLTSYSKRWWGEKVKKARSHYARIRRDWQAGLIEEKEHRENRNKYYRTIRQAKRECWETFIGGPQEVRDKLNSEDTAKCWQALRYTNPKTTGTTPTLRNSEGRTAATIEEKERLVLEHAFPTAPGERQQWNPPPSGNMHKTVDERTVRRALFSQAVKKAPGADRLNFRALRLLWKWDSPRIVALTRQCFRLGTHPPAWKIAKGILLRKANKADYTLVRAYRVISLLNCMGKIVEKVAAEAISEFCEATGALYRGQMGSRKNRCAIDAVACLIQEVHKGWSLRQLAAALFIDVKGAFDHVDPVRLAQRMRELEVDEDLIRWVQSFLTDRRVQLIIDGHHGAEHSVQSGIPQGSPVSPILFAIYLSGIFEEIERKIPGIKILSFADDIGLVTLGNSVNEVCEQLQRAGQVAIAWGQDNAVQFDAEKTEAALFTKKRGQQLNDQIRRADITIANHKVSFNQEATRWLGVWLDQGLTFKTHYHTRMQKAKKAEARIKSLCKQQGLAAGLARRMQIAAVQSVALYGAELWWQGQKDRVRGIQQLVNRQARAVTGMFRTTPIGPLVKEAALVPAETLLNSRQLNYIVRLIGLPGDQPAKQILPITLREGDQHAQPGEQPADDRIWAETTVKGPQNLGQQLAKKLARALPIDPSGGFEDTEPDTADICQGQIRVLPREEAATEAQNARPGLTVWSDGSRLEDGRTGAGIAWEQQEQWRTQKIPIGAGHEVFDAELIGICKALELALKVEQKGPVTVLLDSLAAISRIQHRRPGPGQNLAIRVQESTKQLEAQGRRVTIQWVPGHQDIEGNERADKAAKAAATKYAGGEYREISLAYARRTCTESTKTERQQWLDRTLDSTRPYKTQKSWKQDPILAAAPKKLASRFYQLKTGHAAIGTYLRRIGARDTERCQNCRAPNESTRHLLLECREWRRPRQHLFKELRKAGVELPMEEEAAEARILGEPKAVKAVLNFLTKTTVASGAEQEAARAQRDNEWGLKALMEAEQSEETGWEESDEEESRGE